MNHFSDLASKFYLLMTLWQTKRWLL